MIQVHKGHGTQSREKQNIYENKHNSIICKILGVSVLLISDRFYHTTATNTSCDDNIVSLFKKMSVQKIVSNEIPQDIFILLIYNLFMHQILYLLSKTYTRYIMLRTSTSYGANCANGVHIHPYTIHIFWQRLTIQNWKRCSQLKFY